MSPIETFTDHLHSTPLVLFVLLQRKLYCPTFLGVSIFLNIDFIPKLNFQVFKEQILVYSTQLKILEWGLELAPIAMIKCPEESKIRKKVFVQLTISGYNSSLQGSQGKLKQLLTSHSLSQAEGNERMASWLIVIQSRAQETMPPTFMVSHATHMHDEPTHFNISKKSLTGPTKLDNSTLDSLLG